MADLAEIKSRVDAAAAKVVELKGAKADVAAIKEVVASMLAAKKEYAENNNGIGVDGKPFDDGKKKKKKKEVVVQVDKPVSVLSFVVCVWVCVVLIVCSTNCH